MKYVCLVYHEEETLAAISESEFERLVGECIAYTTELDKAGHHVMSSGLQSVRSASTLRNKNGKLSVTDGPFAETKEFLGGFTILEARDLNEAIQLASKFPTAHLGAIEVRPVLDPSSDVSDPLDRKILSAVRGAVATHCGLEQPLVAN